MPAERTRHAKRLGHAQGPPIQVLADAPSTTTTTTTTTVSQQSATSAAAASTSSQATTTSASASQPSSSVPSSSPTTQSSSAPSSATTSSTPSVAPSAGTQSPAVTPPLSSPTPTTSTSPSLTAPTSTPQTNAAAVENNGLSGGAIAGIVAGAVIVGVALIVFFVRKTYLRRRERKHISWTGAPGLDEPKPLPDVSEPPASFTTAANTPQRSAPLSPFETYGQPMYSTPAPPVVHMRPTIPTYAVPTPPPAAYNNPTTVAAYPTQPIPSAYSPGNTAAIAMARVAPGTGISSTLPSARAQHPPVEAMVKCTFVPTLPDELSITAGERIFVVEQYDDGWDLCANRRGERGMVPHECLEHTLSDQPDIGWRNVQRLSSLNPDERRF